MSRKIAKLLSALLLALAVAVTQIPVSDVEAVEAASDFQIDGTKLLKYTGTAEIVSIPDGIEEIGEEAFAGNINLVKVTIGADVEKIGYRAFAGCDTLRTVEIGDSVKEIETAAFSNNKMLKNVSMGSNVRELGSGVFAGSSQLSELTLAAGNSYFSYQDGVLYDDEKKVVYALLPNFKKSTYTAPSTVEEIKAYAFWGNPYLEEVTLDSALTNVSAYAFSNCMNLKTVNIPLPVRTIEAKAFEDCVNLQKVVLPDSISNISDTAFDGCTGVKFETTPGTYAAEFAAAMKSLEVEQIEYEDVTDSTVISAEELTEEGTYEQATIQPSVYPSAQATVSPSAQGTMQPSAQPSIQPTEQPSSTNLPVEVQTFSGSYSTEKLLGQSSIVAGKAVVFIDNGTASVTTGSSTQIDLSANAQNGSETTYSGEQIGNLITENAEKGKDFPKYTVVNNKIASQAYYQDDSLTEYVIESGIKEIGDFSFARTGLTSIEIPDGVEKIGYGGFYHCDNLSEVTIPNSVTEIDANAFEKTAWLSARKVESAFVIAGNGILLAYSGTDSVVNIPNGIKQIGAEVFKDHMGITAVNIPDSVEVIGENAFSGCKNLTTVNGGNGLVKIGAGAFKDCPLSQVVIPASVQEIGLGAYDYTGGTDTAVFEGTTLPKLTMGSSSARLSNTQARTYALGGVKKVIVKNGVSNFGGTVLGKGNYGFNGLVYDEAGNLLMDLSDGVQSQSDGGVAVQISSQTIDAAKENIMATIPGNEESYVLRVLDSNKAATDISAAYSELYGGKVPSGLYGFDISLYDRSGQIPITKLGKQYITIMLPLPDGCSTENLHMVTLDSDGQLEAVEYQILNLEDGDYIQFKTNHFSSYGIYEYSSYGGQGVVNNGSAFINMSGNKDNTPDTGDGIHPKWILALGLLAASTALFFYKGKKVKIK